ncbi:chromate transporter [Peptococcaceae bacterium CEB3]|nr:chromate transporter [Peptococcaceae bacterium CEB3]
MAYLAYDFHRFEEHYFFETHVFERTRVFGGGVRPVVVVLIAKTSLQMAMTSFSGWVTWAIALVAVIILYYTKVHPAVLIVSSLVLGLLVFR